MNSQNMDINQNQLKYITIESNKFREFMNSLDDINTSVKPELSNITLKIAHTILLQPGTWMTYDNIVRENVISDQSQLIEILNDLSEKLFVKL